MVGLFLIIWFYVYAGLLFARVSTYGNFFPSVGWGLQTLLWPVFTVIYIVLLIKNGNIQPHEKAN